MLLFDIVINQVLLAVDPIQDSFRILAYADDIAIVNSSFDDLQSDVMSANNMIQWCGMEIKPEKCGLLEHMPPLRFDRALNQVARPVLNTFHINNSPITIIDDESGNGKYKYRFLCNC